VCSTLTFKTDIENLKIFAAIGVCFAWLEIIFLLGRYPSLGGTFSIMYYTATKRVIKTALGFFVLIIAFSGAFFIINFGNENAMSLGQLPHAALKIFVMVLGEFEFDELFENSSESSDPVFGFTMVLLLGLIVFGSVVMMNLIVAIIITDMEWLHKMSKEQILLNQAHHAVQIHSVFNLLPFSCQQKSLNKFKSSNLQLEFCVHSICCCGRSPLPKESRIKVFEILAKKGILDMNPEE